MHYASALHAQEQDHLDQPCSGTGVLRAKSCKALCLDLRSGLVGSPKSNITFFMHQTNQRTISVHVPRAHPRRRAPRAPPRPLATRRRWRSSPPERRFWEFFTAHIRKLEHAPRLPRGRPPLRRMVRAPRPHSRLGRADGPHGLRRGVHPCTLGRERQAPARGAPDALRMARHRPDPRLQPDELRPRSEARRQGRKNRGPLRQGDEGPPRLHRHLDPGGPPRPRLPRRPHLQLRARERRGLASRRRLLHPRNTGVFPAPQERRAVQRGPCPPHGPGIRRRLPRGRPGRRGSTRAPFPELLCPAAARPSRTGRYRR